MTMLATATGMTLEAISCVGENNRNTLRLSAVSTTQRTYPRQIDKLSNRIDPGMGTGYNF